MSGIDEVNPTCKKKCYDGEWVLRVRERRNILVGWLAYDSRSKRFNSRHNTIIKENKIKWLNKVTQISCIKCHKIHRAGDIVFERVMAKVKLDVANNRYYIHNGSRETWIDMEMSK